jgi:hypothetical protein
MAFNFQCPAMSTIYVQKEGQRWGPFTTEELEGKVGEGVFSPEDLFWTEGMEEWQPLGEALALEEEPQAEEQQETAEEAVFEVEENNLLFDSDHVRLTARTLHLPGEDIPVPLLAKASVQTETIRRTKPIIGSVILGVIIVCGALVEVHRPNLTAWLLWGLVLAGLAFWWLRIFSTAIRPAATIAIIDLRNGDERIVRLDPPEARELAASVNRAIIEAREG